MLADYNHLVSVATREYSTLIKQSPDQAVVVLSNLIEKQPGDLDTMRQVSFYLLAHEQLRDAYYLLQQIADKRPHEPQAWLALARIAAQKNQADLASLYYEIVLNSKWNPRYNSFSQLALLEYSQLLNSIIQGKQQSAVPDYAKIRQQELLTRAAIKKGDLVVSIEWNTDGSDIDLHVREPSGEEVSFRHKRSVQGGKLSNDITGGYGPEFYRLQRGKRGDYVIGVNYYGQRGRRQSLKTAVYLQVFRNFGKANQSVERKVVLLKRVTGKRWIATAKIAQNAN